MQFSNAIRAYCASVGASRLECLGAAVAILVHEHMIIAEQVAVLAAFSLGHDQSGCTGSPRSSDAVTRDDRPDSSSEPNAF